MRNRLSDEQGFTLIELLVVILIIGILAAIALPNFLGQRGRAQDAGAKSNARNAVSQVEACFTDTQDMSRCRTAGDLGNTGLVIGSAPEQVLIEANATGGVDGFKITATSKTGAKWVIAKNGTTGEIVRNCTKVATTKDGACKTSGDTW